jgi:hypothetical protein
MLLCCSSLAYSSVCTVMQLGDPVLYCSLHLADALQAQLQMHTSHMRSARTQCVSSQGEVHSLHHRRQQKRGVPRVGHLEGFWAGHVCWQVLTALGDLVHVVASGACGMYVCAGPAVWQSCVLLPCRVPFPARQQAGSRGSTSA